MAVYLDYPHGKLYAWVSGAWVNLSADVMMTNNISGKWGINGYKANDLVADTGTLRFTLNNKTGKYYPDGPAPLAGWGRFVPVALHLIYGGVIHYYRFYVDKIDLVPGKVVEQARVSVTCLDWMDFSNRRKITAPNILINVTADVAVNTILNAMPAALQPRSREIMTGENTFLSVFDNIGMKTTAYTELAKLANSEWAYWLCYPGRLGHQRSIGIREQQPPKRLAPDRASRDGGREHQCDLSYFRHDRRESDFRHDGRRAHLRPRLYRRYCTRRHPDHS
jgi:hypothetical protein